MVRYAGVPSPSDVGAPTRRAIEALAANVVSGQVVAGAIKAATVSSASFFPEAWIPWTPTFGNFTLGNGSVTARYMQHGKTVVCRVSVLLGSTSVMGTAPTISLPVAPLSVSFSNPGLGVCQDATGGQYLAYTYWAGSSTVGLLVLGTGGTYVSAASAVTAAIPFTWTVSDFFSFTLMYEAA